MFKRIMGSYRVDKYTGAHLNSPHLQYNSFHTWLGNFPDILVHEPFYFPYSDSGLFGNFLYGNEVFNHQLLFSSQFIMSDYASSVHIINNLDQPSRSLQSQKQILQ